MVQSPKRVSKMRHIFYFVVFLSSVLMLLTSGNSKWLARSKMHAKYTPISTSHADVNRAIYASYNAQKSLSIAEAGASTSIETGKPTVSATQTTLKDVWEKLNTTDSLSILGVKQDGCADVICSNFLDSFSLKCARKINVSEHHSVAPGCHFQNGTSKPRVLLKSFPGSGNTWIRQLLEKATGICTGSVFCDGSIWRSGMIGEGVSTSTVLVVKSHGLRARGDATILIVRNPIDAIVSYWKFVLVSKNIYIMNKGQHITNPPAKYFRNNTMWNTFVEKKMHTWTDMIKGELSFPQNRTPHLVVIYEDMKRNVSREVFRMLHFLHATYSSEEVLERLKIDVTQFKRPKLAKSFDPYTLQQRQHINTHLSELITWLKVNRKGDLAQYIESYLL